MSRAGGELALRDLLGSRIGRRFFALFAVCAAAAGVALAVHRSHRVAVERRRSNDLRR